MLTHVVSILTYLSCSSVRSGCAVVAATLIKLFAVQVVLKVHAAVQNEAVFKFLFWSGEVVVTKVLL